MELRSDIAAAAERMVARDRVTRELRQLTDHLHSGERVHRLCSGTYPAGYGLMAITDRRVVLLREGRAGPVSNEFARRRLSAVDWAPGLLAGTINIADPAGCAELRNVELVEGEEIVRFIRARMRSGSLKRTSRVFWHSLRERRGEARRPGDPNRAEGVDLPIGADERSGPGDAVPSALSPTALPLSTPPVTPARTAEEPETERLVPVGSRPAIESGTGRGRHRPRHGVDQRARSSGWLVAAAAGLIGLVGLGSYQLLSGSPIPPDMSSTPELAAMNAAPAPPTQPPAAVGPNPDPVVGVVRVIDADSVEVAGGASGPVEVLGILAPQDGQCGAEESTSFARAKLIGRVVTLVADPTQPSVDRAGRILAHVKLANGMDYAVLAARAGMAKYHADTPILHADEIKAAQAEAERSNEGLWGASCNAGLAAGS